MAWSVTIRPMTPADLPAVDGWLRQPHVARWWTPETTAETEIDKFQRCIEADGATKLCVVELEGQAIGWCQWYRWDAYPEEAEASGACPGEVGADYAIGDPANVGRGVGTAVIAAVVDYIRRLHPGAGLLIAPEAVNVPSRRVLEKNGFRLVEVRPIATEPHSRPMAVYRLAAQGGS